MAEVKSVDTRERILDVAERLFMGHGYDGTSMRMITGEAAVNLAAVNYHFGSKESLMQEVFRRRLDWLNEERMRCPEYAGASRRPARRLKPSQIVDGFFRHLAAHGRTTSGGAGRPFCACSAARLTEPSEFIRAFLAHEYAAKWLIATRRRLFKALPEVPKAEIVWRFHFMLGATSYAIAGTDALAAGH
jgi:AcrR family transcriptional regulator